MIPIRALILDFGGVISYPQQDDFADNVERILGKIPPNLSEVYRKLRPMFDDGSLNGQEYWAEVLSNCGLSVESHVLESLVLEDARSWTQINPSMEEFMYEARKKVSNLSIISNMPWDIMDYILERFSFFELFDEVTFSCSVGINKPSPGIYEHCLGQIKIPANECLFVDDSIANVEGAINIGMNAIHFKTFPQFQRDLISSFSLVRED